MQSEISTFENLVFRLKEGHLTLATVKRQACLPHHHPWSPKNYDNHKNREGEHCSSGWHNGAKKIMLPDFLLIYFCTMLGSQLPVLQIKTKNLTFVNCTKHFQK